MNGLLVGILVRVELGAGGWHQPQLRQVRAWRQAAGDLLLKLRPVTTRDYCDVGDGKQVSQRLAHRVLQWLLARGERSVEVESNQGDHFVAPLLGKMIPSMALRVIAGGAFVCCQP